MSDPLETLTTAIVVQLEKIQTANGYSVDVNEVIRVDFLSSQLDMGFSLEVLDPVQAQSWETLDAGGYQCRVQFTIAGIIKEGEVNLKDPGRVTRKNACMFATVKALMEDPTFGLGGDTSSWITQPISFVDPDNGDAFFNLTLNAIYSFGRNDL